jgi:myo-inositol-1(or 4)-monophosphatase
LLFINWLLRPPASPSAGHPTIRLVPQPSEPTYEHELAIASAAARAAGSLQMERYERLERIVHKSTYDVVTEVDEMSEQLIIGTIREQYPDDGFLAEESGHSHLRPAAASGNDPTSGGSQPAGDANDPTSGGSQPVGDANQPAAAGGLPAQRLWIIDPLDGTVNYANGIPVFCVSIGLVDGGRPVAGVIYDPVRDELFSAVAGRGAKLDGFPISHPAKEKMSDMVLSLALPRRGWSKREQQLRKRIRVARVMGSAALALAYVGNGRFDGFVQSGGLSLWDITAAGLIAVEGGATVSTLAGEGWFDLRRPDKSIGLVAAVAPHHGVLLELLA